MNWLKNVGGYLLAGLVAVLSVLTLALRFIGIGEQREKARARQAQHEVEQESQEALNDAHAQTEQDIKQAHIDRQHGNADYLNDDKL